MSAGSTPCSNHARPFPSGQRYPIRLSSPASSVRARTRQRQIYTAHICDTHPQSFGDSNQSNTTAGQSPPASHTSTTYNTKHEAHRRDHTRSLHTHPQRNRVSYEDLWHKSLSSRREQIVWSPFHPHCVILTRLHRCLITKKTPAKEDVTADRCARRAGAGWRPAVGVADECLVPIDAAISNAKRGKADDTGTCYGGTW